MADHVVGALVKLPDDRLAQVTTEPVLDVTGQYHICRVKVIATGDEEWAFVAHLTKHDHRPPKEN